MLKKIAIVTLMVLASIVAKAGVKVTALDLSLNGANGYINISTEGRSGVLPDYKVIGKTIEIVLSEAEAFEAISKSVNGAQLSANVFNGKTIVKATLPYEINADGVNIGFKNRKLEVIFPRGRLTRVDTDRPVQPKPEIPVKNENKVLGTIEKAAPAYKLDEEYLNKLLKDEKEKTTVINTNEVKKYVIKVQQSAIDKKAVNSEAETLKSKSIDTFSFSGYIVKFSIFLALVLWLFYGVVQLLKKGVFNRGKLGFLNNTQMIQVLSTTYVAPKRSLMIVKAHKQIFLVANSESGIQFLSEMTDTAGLIKEGEKQVTGTNFEINLVSAENTAEAPELKLKENINESTPVPETKSITNLTAKEIVKFSDELKKKAKKLRPIEFN